VLQLLLEKTMKKLTKEWLIEQGFKQSPFNDFLFIQKANMDIWVSLTQNSWSINGRKIEPVLSVDGIISLCKVLGL
jgi:hypothetical protein